MDYHNRKDFGWKLSLYQIVKKFLITNVPCKEDKK